MTQLAINESEKLRATIFSNSTNAAWKLFLFHQRSNEIVKQSHNFLPPNDLTYTFAVDSQIEKKKFCSVQDFKNYFKTYSYIIKKGF